MKTILLDFSDFWAGFNKEDNFFINLLRKQYKVEISSKPDFLIYSTPGIQHKAYNCIKIFYTGESEVPDYGECDYSITFELKEDVRNIRCPLYVLYGDIQKLTEPKKPFSSFDLASKKFCNMVVSNGSAKKRIDFFHKLSEYKQVDSGGRYLNNVGGPVDDKKAFIANYKFTLAFENTSHPGYTTEKIIEPMYAGSMPLYWGNPLVHLDFNPKSFVNWHDFGSDEAMIDYIIALDQDDTLYEAIHQEPFLPHNALTRFSDEERLMEFFDGIFSSPFRNNGFYLKRNAREFYFKTRIQLGRLKKHP